MNRIKVLFTGAGGAAVPGLIASLQEKDYYVIAADMDRYASGLYLADKGYVIPRAEAEEFVPVMKAICRKEQVDVLIPLVDEELLKIYHLEDNGLTILLPRREFVATCLDKYHLMECLGNQGMRVPVTTLGNRMRDHSVYPAILKPRRGRGSRDIHFLRGPEDLSLHLGSSLYAPDQLLIQEYISGTEFTVSVVVWRDGEIQAVVPKEILSKKGVTKMAVTRRNERIEEICHRVQEVMGADGPFNVQLILDARTREPVIFEINPRYSTTISLTMAAGIDELHGLITQALKGKEAYKFPEWKEGLVLFRRTVDEFWAEDYLKDRSLRIGGSPK